MLNRIKVGTRPSPLALKQVEEAQRLFPAAVFTVVTYETPGDKDKITPISDVEGTDFFTKEIDEALLRGEIDLAVHSSKDLPNNLPDGLSVILETEALSPFDALVSKGDLKFRDLPGGSRIGVSSRRRKDLIRKLRPDLKIVDIRGTIAERLALIDSSKVDALIVAHAALLRLGLEGRVSEILKPGIFPAHPKQGKLSIVGRSAYAQR